MPAIIAAIAFVIFFATLSSVAIYHALAWYLP